MSRRASTFVARNGRAPVLAVRQRGVVMWVALGVLVVMTLAGLAMLRQMSGGLSIAGNIAFKESATSLADLGTETARAWFLAADTTVDGTGTGNTGKYFATWGPAGYSDVDPTTWAWGGITAASDAATGNSVKWIVHRLCQQPGDANAAGQNCVSAGSRAPGRGVPPTAFTTLNIPFYRITTQVTGPRNTVSFTQVMTN